jgi:hypothetical protein
VDDMETVFLVVREFDRAGYRIVGIFTDMNAAELALQIVNDDCDSQYSVNRVVELPVNTYFENDVI